MTAPDPEVEALVADIAGEFRCDACDYLTYDERLVRRAVEAGRAPLLALLKRAEYCLGYLKAPDGHAIDAGGCGCHRCELLAAIRARGGS